MQKFSLINRSTTTKSISLNVSPLSRLVSDPGLHILKCATEGGGMVWVFNISISYIDYRYIDNFGHFFENINIVKSLLISAILP